MGPFGAQKKSAVITNNGYEGSSANNQLYSTIYNNKDKKGGSANGYNNAIKKQLNNNVYLLNYA